MIDIHIPSSLEYNTDNANHLADNLKSLNSIDEIAGWNKQALAQVDDLNSILKAIEEKQHTAAQVISEKQQEFNEKNFLTRFFDGRKEQKHWLSEQSRLEREKVQIENVIDQFQLALNFMPVSYDTLKKMLEDSKLQKNELHTEMKAATALKSSIRAKFRLKKANTNYGKYGKSDRLRIKLNKKSELKSQDDHRIAIQRQINELDQLISWLEGF